MKVGGVLKTAKARVESTVVPRPKRLYEEVHFFLQQHITSTDVIISGWYKIVIYSVREYVDTDTALDTSHRHGRGIAHGVSFLTASGPPAGVSSYYDLFGGPGDTPPWKLLFSLRYTAKIKHQVSFWGKVYWVARPQGHPLAYPATMTFSVVRKVHHHGIYCFSSDSHPKTSIESLSW